MNRITIKDIAKLLSLNPSTVSRALKDHPDVSPATKAKIKSVAQELGYQPNFQAIYFRRKSSHMVGLILPDINMFFFPSLIKAIEEETRKNGYNLIVFQSGELLTKEIQHVNACQAFGVDGLMICVSKETTNLEHLQQLIHNDVPIVLFDRVVESGILNAVLINDEEAAKQAVQHLIKKGYHSIVGVFDNVNLAITQKRYKGYKLGLKEAGIHLDERNCLFVNFFEEAFPVLRKFLKERRDIHGAFIMSDELLSAFIQVAYELKINIPEDLGVIAISDGKLPYFLFPNITHIRHSGWEIGRATAALLFSMIAGQNPPAQTINCSTSLIELGST